MNERIVVEAIRRAGRIRLDFGDGIIVVPGKEFAHDVAIAVQKYFNESNRKKDMIPTKRDGLYLKQVI